jgi:uncharacterized protein (DUF779 family)
VAGRVVATDAAIAAIERLTVTHGKLMFFQSGGCCDGSSPMCFRAGELLLGPNDLLLGEVGGASFFIDADQHERWNRPELLLDVAVGPAPGFSLEAPGGLHFVTRGVSCALEIETANSGLSPTASKGTRVESHGEPRSSTPPG